MQTTADFILVARNKLFLDKTAQASKCLASALRASIDLDPKEIMINKYRRMLLDILIGTCFIFNKENNYLEINIFLEPVWIVHFNKEFTEFRLVDIETKIEKEYHHISELISEFDSIFKTHAFKHYQCEDAM